jgi:kynurenine formamidase
VTLVEGLAQRLSNWGRWGVDDQLGALNLVTDAKRVEAAGCIRDGSVHSLGFELRSDMPQPSGSGRLNPQHFMVATPADTPASADVTAGADDVVMMAVHAATHWDALSHVVHHDQMYNGASAALVATSGALRNDIIPVARRMVTRGVLLDVAAYNVVPALPKDHNITAGELQAVLDAQGVELHAGDALLVRTGHLGWTKTTGEWGCFTQRGEVMPSQPGLDTSCLPWLRERDVCAVAADNWAVEYLAGGAPRFPFHEVALVYMGMILGEMFELDELASACAADRRYDFLLAAAPLPLSGGVGGPVNPMVVR